jgi:hypothetical protein
MFSLSLAILLTTGGMNAQSEASTAASCPPSLSTYSRNVLYFGLSSALVPGRTITPDVWRAFSSEVLTKHFRDGMTVVDSNGEWRRPDGSHYGEPTKLVIVLYRIEADSIAIATVQTVIAEAKRRFGYRSVLWERSLVCASF